MKKNKEWTEEDIGTRAIQKEGYRFESQELKEDVQANEKVEYRFVSQACALMSSIF